LRMPREDWHRRWTMSECCCCGKTDHRASECPLCGAIGQPVAAETIGSLVTGVAISPGDDFYVCLAPDCEAVYFSGNVIIRQANVTVPAGWKEGATPKYACYCNRVTEDQVINAGVDGCARTVRDVSRLTGAMKNGSCLLNNPKGRCCHEDIESLIRRALRQ
jgi:hypothetical protein